MRHANYGKPFKWELRKKIRELTVALNQAWARSHEYRREMHRLQVGLGGEIMQRERVEKELADLRGKLLELARAGLISNFRRETPRKLEAAD
jgi:hypothetical protein